MTVALFLPTLRGGGAERVMVNLARGFSERGRDVDLVLSCAQGPYLADVPKDVNIVDLGSKRVLYSLPALVRYLRMEQPEAMLSALDHANIVALLAKKLAGVPTRVAVSVHNTKSRSVAGAQNSKDKLMPYCMKSLYPWAHAIVAVSKGVAEDLASTVGLPINKIHIIYNPVVTMELFARADEPLDHPWFQSGEPPVILGAGRLTAQKDFPTLIRAFALVRQKLPARLMIISEGEERPKLNALVKELGLDNDVALPGFVDNPYSIMKHARIFVLSSLWEGLPTVLIEAMALGTPVVSTDCPSGPAEILDGGKWGQLVPVRDEKALAAAIIAELNKERVSDPSECIKRFSLNPIVAEYSKILGLDA